MSDEQKGPPGPPEGTGDQEGAESLPPFEPDLDAITYIERSPAGKTSEARRIFPRDPGASARRRERKRTPKKGQTTLPGIMIRPQPTDA